MTDADHKLALEHQRKELTDALQAFNAELGQFEVWSATMSPIKAEDRRADLIAKKADIERKLSAVRLRIKEMNIAQAAAAKAASDERRAAGLAQHERETSKQRARTEARQKHTTPGTEIQGIARYLMKKLEALPNPLPHTITFANQLGAFIVEQRKHLAGLHGEDARGSDLEQQMLDRAIRAGDSMMVQALQTPLTGDGRTDVE